MSYSCNDNQNYFWEADSGRTTSRVLAPPGGATSICLGSYEEPAAPPKAKKVVAEAVGNKAEEKEEEEAKAEAKEEKQRECSLLCWQWIFVLLIIENLRNPILGFL